MNQFKLTVKFPSGWALFWGLMRIAGMVFIAFNAPWFVTVLTGLMQLHYESEVK